MRRVITEVDDEESAHRPHKESIVKAPVRHSLS